MSWIVVRVRSNVNVERSIRETMDYLNLTKVNHAVIIPENEQYRGMLQKAKDYITLGEKLPKQQSKRCLLSVAECPETLL